MSVDPFLAPVRVEPERDRWGRPLVVAPDGKRVGYTRCTTYIGCLEDTHNLSLWQQRMVAKGLVARPDLLAAAATAADDKALNRTVEAAREAAAASAKATTGTALHALTERIDRGEDLGPIPQHLRADLDAYVAAMREHGFAPVSIEQFSVLDELRIGGTSDRVVRCRDGRLRILDLKTGSVDYAAGKIAMQLAVYARSTPYDVRTDQRGEWPEPIDLDEGIVVHLPSGEGKCTMHRADLAAGWRGVDLARQVRSWRDSSKRLLTVLDQHEGSSGSSADVRPENVPPVVLPVDPRVQPVPPQVLDDLIAKATSRDELVLMRSTYVAVGSWLADHDALAAARLNLLRGGLVA